MNSLSENKIQKINILYIDDQKDPFITNYLMEEYKYKNFEIIYNEVTFSSDTNYEELLNDEKVKEANIIVIDSSLFKEDSVNNIFTGEEFKIILKKYFPYIEVVIVSQINEKSKYGIVEKFKASKQVDIDANEYYNKKLKPLLDSSIEDIAILRNILEKLNKNETINQILKEKIENSMNGIIEYNDFTSKDIDDLIEEFKKLEKILK